MSAASSSASGAASAATLKQLGWSAPTDPEGSLFPLGGMLLLLALLAAAVAAWWFGPRRQPARLAAGWTGLGARRAADLGEPQVVSAQRLDAHNRLYVVRWRDTELLVGVGLQSAPVVLDRRSVASNEPRP